MTLSFASAENIDNQTLTSTETGTFSDLSNTIYGAEEGDTITLDRDYVWSENDGYNGIPIYYYVKNITIDGNGHSIDEEK